MRKYIFVGLGGFLGAILRFLLKDMQIGIGSDIPFGTLFVNISGCFILAFIMIASTEILKIDHDIKLGITTGFLGAYTTFSTFCKEAALMIEQSKYLSAAVYMSLSILLSLAVVYLAYVLVKFSKTRLLKKSLLKNEE